MPRVKALRSPMSKYLEFWMSIPKIDMYIYIYIDMYRIWSIPSYHSKCSGAPRVGFPHQVCNKLAAQSAGPLPRDPLQGLVRGPQLWGRWTWYTEYQACCARGSPSLVSGFIYKHNNRSVEQWLQQQNHIANLVYNDNNHSVRYLKVYLDGIINQLITGGPMRRLFKTRGHRGTTLWNWLMFCVHVFIMYLCKSRFNGVEDVNWLQLAESFSWNGLLFDTLPCSWGEATCLLKRNI